MSIYNAFNSGIILINLDLIDVYSSMKTGCEIKYIKPEHWNPNNYRVPKKGGILASRGKTYPM